MLNSELFKFLMFKIGGSAEFTYWGHTDHRYVVRRAAGAGAKCDRMLNGGRFSKHKMTVTNLDI